MNEPNPWETHLHSWQPRRPAARLKARLFGAAPRSHSVFAGAAFWWRLTPVLGCLVLTMMIIQADQSPAHFKDSTHAHRPLALLDWSDQFVQFGGEADCNRNRWQVATFASTKASPSNSTMSSFRLWRTNSLMRN